MGAEMRAVTSYMRECALRTAIDAVESFCLCLTTVEKAIDSPLA
jgi:hypothetical protein